MKKHTREISPMRWCLWLWLLLFLPVLLPSVNAQDDYGYSANGLPAHVDTALTYFGPKEHNKENHGPDVERFLSTVGLGPGYPYCAAFNSYCLEVAGSSYPTVRSALSIDFITDRSIDAKKVMRGQRNIPSGYIHVMPKGNTGSGHTGFVLLPWTGATGIVIDANTGLGLPGQSERDGQGVWIRKRQIYTACYFCIKYFTPYSYEN